MSATTLLRVLRCATLLPLVVRQLLLPAAALPAPSAKLLHEEAWRSRHGQAALRMLPSGQRPRILSKAGAIPEDIDQATMNTSEGVDDAAMNTSQAATPEDIDVDAVNTSLEQGVDELAATPEGFDFDAMNNTQELTAFPEDIDVAVLSISQDQAATPEDIDDASVNTSQEDVDDAFMNTSDEQATLPDNADFAVMNTSQEQAPLPEDIDVAVMSINQDQADTPEDIDVAAMGTSQEQATFGFDNESSDFEQLRFKACRRSILKQQAKRGKPDLEAKIQRKADVKKANKRQTLHARKAEVQVMKKQVLEDLAEAMQALRRDSTSTVRAEKEALLEVYNNLMETTQPCVNLSGTYNETGPGNHSISIQVEQTYCNISIFMRQMHHYGRADGEKVLVDSFESDAHVLDNGDIEWSDGGYWSRQADEDELQCDQADITLTAEEVMHAKCPAGRYLGLQSVNSHRERARRLQKALCSSKAAGKVWTNTGGGQSFASHGYMTHESSIWPKRHECVEPREGEPAKTFEFNEDTAVAEAHVDKRLVYEHGKIEFRWVPRAASSTVERFVECEVSSGRETMSNASFDELPVVVASVRHPIDRFVSSANDVFERVVNRQCNDQPCNARHGFTDTTPQAVRNATTWYSFLNGLDTFDGNMHSILERLIHDTSCNYKYYASDRMVTQTAAVSQLPGKAAPIDLIVKVENMEPGFKELTRLIHGRDAKPSVCHSRPRNIADCVQTNDKLPTRHAIKEALLQHADLMRELCLIYAQDFVCFDYDLPPACSYLF